MVSRRNIGGTALFLTLISFHLAWGPNVSAENELRGKISIQSIQKDDENLWEKPLQHPLKLDSREFKNIIWKLHFSRRLVDLWQDPERIFDKKTVNLIAEHFRRKLLTVKSNEIIHFSLRTPMGRTKGDVFVLKDALNWRFSVIKGMEYHMDSQSVEQETSGEILVNWRMAPQKDQKFFYYENTLGLKTREETWVTVPFKNGEKANSKTVAPDHEKEDAALDGAAVKEKLKLLKEWKEENLISEEEYKKKVNKLLDRF